jgi:hypothetical protein
VESSWDNPADASFGIYFQIIRQLYAKTGQTKKRTSLLLGSSVFRLRSVAKQRQSEAIETGISLQKGI